jgi:glycosyltransferase involved in cell wall biosynthesis
VRISICIPTYNRAAHLSNCLQSIVSNKSRFTIDFEVCVSDNCSTDGTEKVVRRVQANMDIRYQKNSENLGVPGNFINVVAMARGEFVWLLGDDDLLMPYALEKLNILIGSHPRVDFFYVNAYFLTAEFVQSFPQPFNTVNLPKKLKPFSSWSNSGEMEFMDLVDPKISFDFLGGMYLSVFRRENWKQNVGVLDDSAVKDRRIFSHFDNTFPQLKIFSRAFANSRAYFNAEPLSVCLSGVREWAPMSHLVQSVRLVEALEEYRKNGLPFIRYILCKNFALSRFMPALVWMIIHREHSGYAYINPLKLILANCWYPNFYFSTFTYLFRQIKKRQGKASSIEST